MNLPVQKMWENSLVQQLVASQEGPGFMELVAEFGRSLRNGNLYPTDESTVLWGRRIFN
jgi:hypothetical protein